MKTRTIWIVYAEFPSGFVKEIGRFTNRLDWKNFVEETKRVNQFIGEACNIDSREIQQPIPEEDHGQTETESVAPGT